MGPILSIFFSLFILGIVFLASFALTISPTVLVYGLIGMILGVILILSILFIGFLKKMRMSFLWSVFSGLVFFHIVFQLLRVIFEFIPAFYPEFTVPDISFLRFNLLSMFLPEYSSYIFPVIAIIGILILIFHQIKTYIFEAFTKPRIIRSAQNNSSQNPRYPRIVRAKIISIDMTSVKINHQRIYDVKFQCDLGNGNNFDFFKSIPINFSNQDVFAIGNTLNVCITPDLKHYFLV